MTEKRNFFKFKDGKPVGAVIYSYEESGVDEFTLNSKKQFRDINNEELKGTNQLLDELNKLEDRIITLQKENKQLKSFVEYKKRQHKHWKRECLENIKEIAQLKREIVQLKGDFE